MNKQNNYIVLLALAAITNSAGVLGGQSFAQQRSISFEIRPDGRYHTYEIDLSSSPYYKGAITGLRLDPVSTGQNSDYIKIEYISWREKPK